MRRPPSDVTMATGFPADAYGPDATFVAPTSPVVATGVCTTCSSLPPGTFWRQNTWSTLSAVRATPTSSMLRPAASVTRDHSAASGADPVVVVVGVDCAAAGTATAKANAGAT